MGQNNNQQHGITNSNCVSSGAFEKTLFRDINRNIQIARNQSKLDTRTTNKEAKKDKKLARIEAKQQKKTEKKEIKQVKKEEKKAAKEKLKAEKTIKKKNKRQGIVLSSDIAKLEKGMTKKQAVKLLGKPKKIGKYPGNPKMKILIYDNLKVFVLKGKIERWVTK